MQLFGPLGSDPRIKAAQKNFEEDVSRGDGLVERFRRIYRTHQPEKNRASMMRACETARDLVRTFANETYLQAMPKRDRDENLLLMGQTIGRLYTAKTEEEFDLILQAEWYW